MNTKQLINNYQTCIEILEGIQHFERLIQSKKDSINGFPGTFPELRRKYWNDIDTYQRCIRRLNERHMKILKVIQPGAIQYKNFIIKKDEYGYFKFQYSPIDDTDGIVFHANSVEECKQEIDNF